MHVKIPYSCFLSARSRSFLLCRGCSVARSFTAFEHGVFLDRRFSHRYVPQSRSTFQNDFYSTTTPPEDAPSNSRKTRWGSLADIMDSNRYRTKRRRYHMLLWLCTASALSGTMPLLYKAICFQEQGLLNNNPNHPLVAPVACTDEETSKRLIQVDFDTCVLSDMQWEFLPSQKRIIVTPGETALAFFTATNTADRPVLGYAIYTVTPAELGQFFNKVQCFCFEEQMLSPGESVDLPVLFYIDPQILEEPRINHIDRCTLTYIFCESESQVPEEYLKLSYIQEQLQTQRRATAT